MQNTCFYVGIGYVWFKDIYRGTKKMNILYTSMKNSCITAYMSVALQFYVY